MSYQLHFEQPHFPPDTEFGVSNLGVITNGGSLEIDEDAERSFLAVYHTTIEDAYSGKAGYSLTGSSSLSDEEKQQYLPAADENVEPAPVAEPELAQVEENTPVEGV